MEYLYRFFFLYVEPISAITGAFYAFVRPETYLDLTHAVSAPKGGVPKATQIVMSQLSNLYLLFALNEALVLRSTSDLRVWRTLLFCLLLADFGHLYSIHTLGARIYWDFPRWNAIDWGNVGFVYWGAAMRLSFLLGYGVQKPSTRRPTRRKASREQSRIAG